MAGGHNNDAFDGDWVKVPPEIEEPDEELQILETSEIPILISVTESEGQFSKAQTTLAKKYPVKYEIFQVVVSAFGFPCNIVLELPRIADGVGWLWRCSMKERREWVKAQLKTATYSGLGYAFSALLRFNPRKLVAGICYVVEEMIKKRPTPPDILPPDQFQMEINGDIVIFSFNNKSGQPKPDVRDQDRAGTTRVGKGTKEPNPATASASATATDFNSQRRRLESPWTFWRVYTCDEFQSIFSHTVRTVSDFVSKSRQMGDPTKLDLRFVLYFYKGVTKPWENPDAVNGDKWIVTFSTKKSDAPWLDTLLALIGGKFSCGDDICGALAYTTETEGRIALCTKKDTNDAAQVSIGKQWKGILDGRGSITFHVGGKMDDHKREASILSEVEAEMVSEEQRAQVASASEGIKDAKQTVCPIHFLTLSILWQMVSEKQRAQVASASEGIKDAKQTVGGKMDDHKREASILSEVEAEMVSEEQRAQVASASEGTKDDQQTMVSENQRKESAPPVISQDSSEYFLAEAIHSFTAASENELSLSVGDYVVVRK